MKKSFSVLIAIALNLSLSAQDRKVANKLFYAEFGGPGVIMSANFDARFNFKERLGLGYRLGTGFGIKKSGGYYSLDSDEYGVKRITYYSFPAGLNYVFGKHNSAHTFEVGAGVTLLTRKVSLFNYSNNVKPGNAIGFFTFMYRLMPVDGGFSFRIGLTPIIGTSGDLFPMGAIGFGYVF